MSQGQRNTGSHRARGRRGAEADLSERSLEPLQQGARPGALVAVWLRHPRVSATGQGAEQRSATVGAVSFC